MTKLRARLHGAAKVVAGRAAGVARRHNWLVDEPTGRAGGAPSQEALDAGGLVGFNALLHGLRSYELARMPRVTGTMLSAGCSDASYFAWIAAWYGAVDRHIGVELYLPEPDDLPAGVEWLKRSVGDMTDVEDGSVGLVFSGQNFEHLFGDDAVEFLLEAQRVLEPGGWLVMDSPNREVTSALVWTQPQHTVEFTPSEAAELVTLAGFDVAGVRGLWLCRDAATGGILPLWAAGDADPPHTEVLRRSILASHDPANSFVWWLEAARASREPDRTALRARYAEIYAQAWAERQQRISHAIGERRENGGQQVVSVPEAATGYALYGPFMPLVPGDYQVTFTLRRLGTVAADQPVAVLDVAHGEGTVITDRSVLGHELPENVWTDLSTSFTLSKLVWGGQFRVFSTGAAALEVKFGAVLHAPQ
ncbi:MAG: methyltransferase domain-containing protein [Actinomycetota bacterium]